MERQYESHGSGQFELDEFRSIGDNVVFEHGVLVFHPEAIELGNNVYIGHNTILKAYYKNFLRIGNNTWIGQNCFFHSAGGVSIGNNVGIGPHVKILTSFHKEEGRDVPILFSELEFGEVVINDDCDIGTGSIIMPGVEIGTGAQIGAGAVVTTNIPDYSVAVGVPAKVVRSRK